MQLFLLLLVFLAPDPVAAAVYKWVDDQGQTQFSDRPHPNSEQVEPLEVQTYEAPPPSAPIGPQPAQPPVFGGYQSVEVLSPVNDETIWDNTGNLTVRVSLTPALQESLGHKIVILVDGKKISDGAAALEFHLSNLDRGTHTVQATVLDAGGQQLAESTPITFHLKKHSVLLP